MRFMQHFTSTSYLEITFPYVICHYFPVFWFYVLSDNDITVWFLNYLLFAKLFQQVLTGYLNYAQLLIFFLWGLRFYYVSGMFVWNFYLISFVIIFKQHI